MPGRALVKRFLIDQSGATAIEYCLVASLIAMAIFGSLTALGPKLNRYFVQIAVASN